MGDFYLDISLFVVLCGAVLGLVFWLSWRSHKKEEREHADALAALANGLGGTVTGPDGASAWSAELRGPMASEARGLVNRLQTSSRRRFDAALDFRRGSWQVRVSEASMKKTVSNGTTTFREHRIEVVTAHLAPLKLCRRLHTDFRGRPLAPGHILTQGGTAVREAPLTVERQQGQWLQARLPSPVEGEFVAFTSDPFGVARVLNPQAAEWLHAQADSLPLLLTFESGLLYATMAGRIDPERLLPTVDAVLGLLDRIPGAAPTLPTTTT